MSQELVSSFRVAKKLQLLADSAEIDSILHIHKCFYFVDDLLGILLNRETDSTAMLCRLLAVNT